jgi:hypothetical protein
MTVHLTTSWVVFWALVLLLALIFVIKSEVEVFTGQWVYRFSTLTLFLKELPLTVILVSLCCCLDPKLVSSVFKPHVFGRILGSIIVVGWLLRLASYAWSRRARKKNPLAFNRLVEEKFKEPEGELKRQTRFKRKWVI